MPHAAAPDKENGPSPAENPSENCAARRKDMTGGPRSLKDLLDDGALLGRLRQEVDRRVELADHLRSGLPPDLQPALLDCNLRNDGTLVVTTPSSAWAARLRFETETLLERCRQQHPAAARVRVRVRTG